MSSSKFVWSFSSLWYFWRWLKRTEALKPSNHKIHGKLKFVQIIERPSETKTWYIWGKIVVFDKKPDWKFAVSQPPRFVVTWHVKGNMCIKFYVLEPLSILLLMCDFWHTFFPVKLLKLCLFSYRNIRIFWVYLRIFFLKYEKHKNLIFEYFGFITSLV